MPEALRNRTTLASEMRVHLLAVPVAAFCGIAFPAGAATCKQSDLLIVGDLYVETIQGIAHFAELPSLPYENVAGRPAEVVAFEAVKRDPRVIIMDYYSYLYIETRKSFIDALEGVERKFYYIAFGYDLNSEVGKSGRSLRDLLINPQSAFYGVDGQRITLINVPNKSPFTSGPEGETLRLAIASLSDSGVCSE